MAWLKIDEEYGWGCPGFDVGAGRLQEGSGLCEECGLPLEIGSEVAIVNLAKGPEVVVHLGCLPPELGIGEVMKRIRGKGVVLGAN